MNITNDLLNRMNRNIIPNKEFFVPEKHSTFKPIISKPFSKGEQNLRVCSVYNLTDVNAQDARNMIQRDIGSSYKTDEMISLRNVDGLFGDAKIDNDDGDGDDESGVDLFMNDNDNNDGYDDLHCNLSTPIKTIVVSSEHLPASQFALNPVSINTNGVEIPQIDQLGKILVKCIHNLETVTFTLFQDVYKWTCENRHDLHDREDWEILFSLIYTQYFQYKSAGCAIYRAGEFICTYVEGETNLTSTEQTEVNKTLKLLRLQCGRAVRRIQSIILDIFRTIEDRSGNNFKLVPNQTHELYQLTVAYKSFLENHDDVECLNSLRTAIGNAQNSKLMLLV